LIIINSCDSHYGLQLAISYYNKLVLVKNSVSQGENSHKIQGYDIFSKGC